MQRRIRTKMRRSNGFNKNQAIVAEGVGTKHRTNRSCNGQVNQQTNSAGTNANVNLCNEFILSPPSRMRMREWLNLRSKICKWCPGQGIRRAWWTKETWKTPGGHSRRELEEAPIV
ncbi:hypothetical protein M758_UG176200 [Ceratodon purpureus]|nr:hypothetical protein M758_UG176200 [Ceratodon purpureus]